MNNLQKSLKELFHVNHEAGILRLFFAAALIFVLWSLFAAISASVDTFGSLDLRNILGINSENLAFSLFLDIFGSYFSIFSLSLILLIVFIAYICFESIADFFSRLKSLSFSRMSKDYLTFCAFSFPRRKKLLFPEDQINPFGDILQGPLEVGIKHGYALLVKNKTDVSVKFDNSDNSENIQVSLAFRDKIIDCFNLNPSSILFSMEDKELAKSFLIEMGYSYDLPTDNENMTKFVNMLALFDSGNIRKIVESILVSVTKIALSQYLRNSPASSTYGLSQVREEQVGNNENISKELGQKKYPMNLNFYNKVKGHGIKRNRKRPAYLPPRPELTSISKKHEENISPSLKDQINELLAISLQSTSLYLFGIDIIKAKIFSINEQGSK